MLSLKKSAVFQKDYKNWRERIINVTDNEQLHKELSRLLNELVGHINFLDGQHQELVNNNRLSAQSTETKTRIAEIRKTLDKKLNDYEQGKKK